MSVCAFFESIIRRSQSATTKEIRIKTFRNLFTNPWFVFAIVLYLISLLVLSQRAEFSISDAMMELVIFGIAFPLLAWWASRRAEHLPINVHPTGGEMLAVVAYVLALSVYLAFGPQAIDSWLPQNWIASDRIRFFITLSKKLLVFVALPLAIFGPIWGYSARDFGFQKAGLRELRRTHLSVVLVGSGVLMAFNYFLGGAAAPLREGKFSGSQLLIGLPLCFIWLTIEAGLVEEFFFRAFLQTRLSAWFRSEVTGVVLMALIFGLAHAPGFILPARGGSGRTGRKSQRARCHRLFHCHARGKRCFFWRDLGPNEKPFRADAHTRRSRSLSESFRFRKDLVFVEAFGIGGPRATERLIELCSSPA